MKLTLITCIFLLFCGIQASFATNPIETSLDKSEIISIDNTTPSASTSNAYVHTTKKKKGFFSKITSWVVTKVNAAKAALGGLDDDVDKWFWFGVIGLGLSIIFYSLIYVGALGFILGLLGTLTLIGGSICFTLWLIKKFS